MSFKNIPSIDYEYRSLLDDVISRFYIPCLKEAKIYKRATAYFSSSILLQISKGLSSFADNGGKIQLLVSPDLSPEDYDAISKGYDLRQKVIEKMENDFNEDIDFEQKRDRFTLLSYLIEKGILDIKVAIPESESDKALFHEKLGIMKDSLNNTIAFTGSANETSQAFNSNYETIDVYCDWKSDEAYERCVGKDIRFDRMWDGLEPKLTVIDFPTIIRDRIIKYNEYNKVDFKQLDIDLETIIRKRQLQDNYPNSSSVKLFDYQIDAINSWIAQNYRSCLVLATGTGKTFIGCGAITELFNKTKKLAVVICCPYTHLVDQWCEETKLFNIDSLPYYSSTKNYETIKRRITKLKTDRSKFVCIVTTNGSFMTNKFQELLNEIVYECLLLVDEAHNFGAKKISKYMDERIPYRLALSATLERYGDAKGTQRLLDYFGEISYEYSLERAITENKLTKYYYYPKLVYLNSDEYERYQVLTEKINKFHVDPDDELPEALKRLLIKRARIIAETKDKLKVLEECLIPYKDKSNLLIYCGAVKYENDSLDQDDIKQINEVRALLKNKLNIISARFTAEETSEERRAIIRAYKDEEIQALVAIKCLDEGVNVPAIKTAFILASSTNPKEYIQRRGRVLRKYPGKEYAEIYDFITLPRRLEDKSFVPDNIRAMERGLVKREFVRLRDFANLSKNPSESNDLMDKIKSAYDIDIIEEDSL